MNGEYDYEPVRGLPETLPAGEKILWQGEPRWQSLAIEAYHCRRIALYFAILLAWRAGHGLATGESLSELVVVMSGLTALAVVAVGLLTLLAWLSARSTVYTITNRRVVLRHGVALPMTMNVPLNVVASGAVKAAADGVGEIALALNKGTRISYILTWPHVRRWHFSQPQPALRAVSNVREVAGVLTQAMAETHGSSLAIEPAATEGSRSGSLQLPPQTSVAA